MDAFFKEPTDDTYEKLSLICNVIYDVGYLYRKSFDKALKKVRSQSGGEDFTLRLWEITGTVWDY